MRLAVARIGRPHGIKGEVTIETLTDRPEERFIEGMALESDSALHPMLEISRVRVHQGIWMLTFAQIADRNEAERLRNCRLYADIDIDDDEDESDSYHVEQLKGLKIQDSDGREIGVVVEVESLPGQDLLKVETANGERLIPMVQQFIQEIDLDRGRIVVTLPDGLVD